ncbi:hypothetical protein F4677DRAFT_445778 [Hypoxylon crocopeplum]|nr:hypothetical protein F4677DRAFT_445778 [Hypoxylon crocopeplum]
MADFTELELKAFDLSGGGYKTSLHVTSLAIISGLPSQFSPEELSELVLSKQLWLVSPGICRIQIVVNQSQLPKFLDETEFDFLEFLSEAVCRCPLWPVHGLTIKLEDIQDQPAREGDPNLYFIVEHVRKSSALLSPPHLPTARFDGIECSFRYQPVSSETSDDDMDGCCPEMDTHIQALSDDSHPGVLSSNYRGGPKMDIPTTQIRRQWDEVAYLSQMALVVITGNWQPVSGLELFKLDMGPSLLDLAPAIWNAHYLQALTVHSNTFPVVSTILAAACRGQSPSLRRKSANLVVNAVQSNSSPVDTGAGTKLHVYRNSIQQKLWDLAQKTLKPTIHLKHIDTSFYSQWDEIFSEAPEPISLEANDIDKYDYDDPTNTLGRLINSDIEFGDAPGQHLHRFPGFQA